MRHLILGFLVIGTLLTEACKKELSASGSPTTVTLQFTDVVGIAPLKLDTVYTNSLGEYFNVSAFEYYISNIQLISENGSQQNIPGIYHLVNLADSASQTFSFPATADSLIGFSFLIGVDSAHNVDGDHSGDLDASNGMFWSPAAGFIMAKLEGVSPDATTTNETFQYDIGGFNGPNSVLRKVTLSLSSPVTLSAFTFDTLAISLDADVDKWFLGTQPLQINANSTCTSPGPLAAEYANNYALMFTIRNVQIK
jgi:hypothetical protein